MLKRYGCKHQEIEGGAQVTHNGPAQESPQWKKASGKCVWSSFYSDNLPNDLHAEQTKVHYFDSRKVAALGRA